MRTPAYGERSGCNLYTPRIDFRAGLVTKEVQRSRKLPITEDLFTHVRLSKDGRMLTFLPKRGFQSVGNAKHPGT